MLTELHTQRCSKTLPTQSVSNPAKGTTDFSERDVWGQASQCLGDKMQAPLPVPKVRHDRGGHRLRHCLSEAALGAEGTMRCRHQSRPGVRRANLSQENKYHGLLVSFTYMEL